MHYIYLLTCDLSRNVFQSNYFNVTLEILVNKKILNRCSDLT